MFYLRDAFFNDVDMLAKFKLKTILESDTNNTIDDAERERIIAFIDNHTKKYMNQYKIVMLDNIPIGIMLVYEDEDGVLLDELYLIEEYRNQGIGTHIIQDIIKNNDRIYLWVYKSNNRAIQLYERLAFKIIEESKTRYKMLYIR